MYVGVCGCVCMCVYVYALLGVCMSEWVGVHMLLCVCLCLHTCDLMMGMNGYRASLDHVQTTYYAYKIYRNCSVTILTQEASGSRSAAKRKCALGWCFPVLQAQLKLCGSAVARRTASGISTTAANFALHES